VGGALSLLEPPPHAVNSAMASAIANRQRPMNEVQITVCIAKLRAMLTQAMLWRDPIDTLILQARRTASGRSSLRLSRTGAWQRRATFIRTGQDGRAAPILSRDESDGRLPRPANAQARSLALTRAIVNRELARNCPPYRPNGGHPKAR
jgi:hypothetical protein